MNKIQTLITTVGLAADSYKITHWLIYDPKMQNMSSYLEARAASSFSDEVVFFGLQYLLKSFLGAGSDGVIHIRDLARIKAFCDNHFYGEKGMFNEDGWKHIINNHGGKLPVSIRAVLEGTVVPVGHVLMTIEVTDEKCAWLTNFLETVLVQVWNTITVASLSRAMKKTQYEFMKMTTEDDLIKILMPSRVHDFGFRGVSSRETAALSGAAHLVNFSGTDTIVGIELINQFYCGNDFNDNMKYDNSSEWNAEESYRRWNDFYSKNMFGFSIAATEHSQMTLGGPNGEEAILENYLKKFPSGFIACVIDSFDTFNFINNISGGNLKALVLGRNGVLVHRPDSDDGDTAAMVVSVLEAMGKKFGFERNRKNYKVLNNKVRVIQGDGVNVVSHRKILETVVAAGWSAENLAFGSGGALLQKVNRDTFAFAMKASYVKIDNKEFSVYKKPKANAVKASKRGRLALVKDKSSGYKTVPESEADKYESGNLLVEVFRNGELLVDQNFKDIKARAELPELS